MGKQQHKRHYDFVCKYYAYFDVTWRYYWKIYDHVAVYRAPIEILEDCFV
jgi:hypothetical protein